jgi:hypothetical protein
MKNTGNYKSYCITFGESFKEVILEAIKKKEKSLGTEDEDFNTGYLCAFHRILTLMQQQAEIFELPFEELGIDFKETELI